MPSIERWLNIPPHLFIVRTVPLETLRSQNHEFSLKLQISVMVSTAVSKMGMTELIFVVPAMKVNGQYNAMFYSPSRCCQRSSMMQAIRLSFNNTTLHLIVQGHH